MKAVFWMLAAGALASAALAASVGQAEDKGSLRKSADNADFPALGQKAVR